MGKALYGNKSITQLELVRKIQDILQELHDTGRSFPKTLVLDFNQPLRAVTRTGASLYLMLFQVSYYFRWSFNTHVLMLIIGNHSLYPANTIAKSSIKSTTKKAFKGIQFIS
jgi:hypothetical protein